ncbi:MAG: aminoacyl-tRNA hydrolase, partial [Oscillospiraceae bacterium]|nr:aminoacyl-tRNA hydrolase [Oscillospiraceae bacterium]
SRVRIGVGAPERNETEHDMPDWVLGSFAGKDARTVSDTCERAALAISALIGEGAEKAMNLFN